MADDKQTKAEQAQEKATVNAAQDAADANAERAERDVLDNPKVQIQPGKGELLGPDLVEQDPKTGKYHTVDGVPEPEYDLNADDLDKARKPDAK